MSYFHTLELFFFIWLNVKVNKIGLIFLVESHFISFFWMLMYYHTASLPCSDSRTVVMAFEDGKPCPVYSFLFLLGFISDIVFFFFFRSTHNEMEKNRYVIKSSCLCLVLHVLFVSPWILKQKLSSQHLNFDSELSQVSPARFTSTMAAFWHLDHSSPLTETTQDCSKECSGLKTTPNVVNHWWTGPNRPVFISNVYSSRGWLPRWVQSMFRWIWCGREWVTK